MPALAIVLAVMCGPADGVAAWLRDKHGESIVARALEDDGGLLEIWANQRTQTMTIVRRSGGVRCLVVVGSHFEASQQI